MISYSQLGKYGATGNQMFQYAALVGLSIKTGYTIKIPQPPNESIVSGKLVIHGHNDNHHPIETVEYALGCFSIECDYLTHQDQPQWRYEEPFFHFDSNYFNIPDNTDIMGYFQSEQYFIHCEQEIRKQFTPKHVFMEEAHTFLEKIKGDHPLISLHIRRYGHEQIEQQEIHPLIPMSYYENLAQEFRSHYGSVKFVCFSDDIAWCKKHFEWDDIEFSENNSPIVDMTLMAMCDHNIVANSSFSWWGAWLNTNPNKQVIAPRGWFGPKGPKDTQDLIPVTWRTA